MNSKITSFLLLLSLQMFSQSQYKIIFHVKQVAKQLALTTNYNSYLIGDGKESLYKENIINASYKSQDDNMMQMKINRNPIFTKIFLQKQ